MAVMVDHRAPYGRQEVGRDFPQRLHDPLQLHSALAYFPPPSHDRGRSETLAWLSEGGGIEDADRSAHGIVSRHSSALGGWSVNEQTAHAPPLRANASASAHPPGQWQQRVSPPGTASWGAARRPIIDRSGRGLGSIPMGAAWYGQPFSGPWVGGHAPVGVGQALGEVQNRRGRRRGRRCCAVQLAKHLQSLEEHDPARVIIVKRILRLGFGSQALLQQFFEQFGPVDQVLLVNHEERTDEVNYLQRVRPSGMGYVLMRNAEGAEAVFAQGDEMIVQDTPIVVRRFLRREAVPEGGPADGDAEEMDNEDCSFDAERMYSL